ncbi:MAG: GTPase HflX [Candidatus Omnitrophica bacterium]|nr:GTPase HflX [Candidatus Omnitrophota bacterium]
MTEKILVVAIEFKKGKNWPLEQVAEELKELILSCFGEIVDLVLCRGVEPTPNFLIGEGKVKEIAEICALKSIDTVIFSQELKGSQRHNLEKELGVKVVDRTQVILDIFAKHAKSQEGRMQVELAQLQYLLPRLRGRGTEMSRLGGGIGTLGPGETKLEIDRRRITDRIEKLKKQLEGVSQIRKTKRKKRQNQKIPAISLVGYTNAGKSTLLNQLTKSDQRVYDGFFTTLDPLSRQYVMPNHQTIVLSDTVGFLHDLPHGLIDAFHATLEEVEEADILLHVVDVSNPKFRDFHESVVVVLKELNVQNKPMITVFNKIDKIEDRTGLNYLIDSFENVVFVSGQTGENMDYLVERISKVLAPSLIQIDVHIPVDRMDLVNLLYEEAQVYEIKYTSESVCVRASVPPKVFQKVKGFSIKK